MVYVTQTPSDVVPAKTALIGVAARDGRQMIVHIPAGSEIAVFDDLADHKANLLINVEWAREVVQVFAIDIRERGQVLRPITV